MVYLLQRPTPITRPGSVTVLHSGAGITVPVPFIVGTGRCGTTLLRLMLDAHPDLAIPPETHFIPDVVRRCTGASDPRSAFLAALQENPTWPDFGLDVRDLREAIADLAPFDIGNALRRFYQLYAECRGKTRWGDKTPGYAAAMRLVHEHLPEARFIHLIRDGRDVALSYHDVWFGPASVPEAAAWWLTRIEVARVEAASLPAGQYLEVRYEDLVQRPETVLQEICGFLQLRWDPATLGYHTQARRRLAELERDARTWDGKPLRAADRLAIHERASEPPDAGRVGRWRREMPRPDRIAFEHHAGKLLRELGYEVG